MKIFSLLISFFIITVGTVYSQSLTHVVISGATTLSSFCFTTGQQVIIKISPDGNILEWGIEVDPSRNGYYRGKLDPYMGRVDYYGPESDEAFRGKVKSIGACTITYYSSSQPAVQKGKVKTIGTLQLDYYMDYDDANYRGKLKSAGSIILNYYSSYDNEVYRGKLKAVGNTSLTYYSLFDDKLNKGKIKSIGTSNYTWYNEFDRKEMQGAMKSGSVIQKVNTVTYNIL
ncbi:hypothetical protein [Ferruginibacter sp.]|nr:hypothetical protein [Ferruginibacter sp.]